MMESAPSAAPSTQTAILARKRMFASVASPNNTLLTQMSVFPATKGRQRAKLVSQPINAFLVSHKNIISKKQESACLA